MQTDKHHAHRYSDTASVNLAWQDWLVSPMGKKLLDQETELFNSILPGLRGYALAISSLSQPDALVAGSRNAHRWWLKVDATTKVAGAATELPMVVHDPVQWPFEDDSLDVVVLHHTLEFSQWPHQTLREAVRCLEPSGHLVVVGFNPFSLWGIGRALFGRWSTKIPWLSRFISPWRVADWLTMLDCKVTRAYYTRALFPWQNIFSRWGIGIKLNSKSFSSGYWPGASYALVCKPEVPCLTPIQKSWRRREFTGLPLAGRTIKEAPNIRSSHVTNGRASKHRH